MEPRPHAVLCSRGRGLREPDSYPQRTERERERGTNWPREAQQKKRKERVGERVHLKPIKGERVQNKKKCERGPGKVDQRKSTPVLTGRKC